MEALILLAALFLGTGLVLFRKSLRISRVSATASEPLADWESPPGKGCGPKIFLAGLGIRLFGLLMLVVSGAVDGGISRDSLRYHSMGIEIAERMRGGDFNWPNWIDNGWFQFTGFVYYLFGNHPIWMQLLNVCLGAATGLLAYKIASEVYEREAVARFAGYLTAFFPSFIYYSLLPLKDTVSLFALLLLVLATIRLRSGFHLKHLMFLVLSLLLILGLRDYLFFICMSFVLLSMAPVTRHRATRYIVLTLGLILFLGSLAYILGLGFLGSEFLLSAKYFDLEYINYTRSALNRGYGGFYDSPGAGQWGQGIFSDIMTALTGVYFFFFSIDPTDVGRARQFFALPEMLLVFIAVPALIRGVYLTWNEHRQKALPVMIFAFGVMAVYSSATTNMGAMFRWRMQALPFFLVMLGYGVYRRRKGILFRLMKKLAGRRV